MKITFQGWGHNGKKHGPYPFTPWIPMRGSFVRGEPYYPMQWDGLLALGQLEIPKKERLSYGHYDVTLKFQKAELKNWLKSYIAAEPHEALDLIAEVLPDFKESMDRKKDEG